jgi:hypothetical protein
LKPVAHVTGALTIWDTRCHITTISDNLLSSEFLDYIKTPAYATHHIVTDGGESWVVAVDSILQFSNSTIDVQFIAKIVPQRRMPNSLSSILLEQISVLDRLQASTVPQIILEAEGYTIADNVWGDLILHKYYDVD